MSRVETTRAIEACGVVAVIRMKEPEKLKAVVDALGEGGVRALEVTMTVPGAIQLIEQLKPTLPKGFVLGAGTILDPETARPEVVAMCHRYDVAAIPGCFTPTEILAAWEAGADVVKVFPATALGPGFFKDVRGPLPQVKLMPTGGVSLDNAGDWIAAGAVAVGVGTALLDAKAIAAGDFGVITANAKKIVANVAAARAR
jgi:2-dehydro-3-deoxyphosphogluconate aldolase/(4S)-4-hydroxy-2-oxoglutarate aldolase